MGQKRETGGLVTLKVSLAAVGIDRSGRSEGEGGLGAHQPTLGSGQTVCQKDKNQTAFMVGACLNWLSFFIY